MELTAEEREIIKFVKDKKGNKEIATSLHVSDSTFYRRLKTLCKKFKAKNKLGLAIEILTLGL